MRYLTLLPLLSIVFFAGCATTGSNDGRIMIETRSQGQPLSAATCVAKTDSGTWKLTTPDEVVISMTDGDLHVACSKSGYRTQETIHKAPPGINFPYMGIGAGTGGVGLGAAMNFQREVGKPSVYPSRVTVELAPL